MTHFAIRPIEARDWPCPWAGYNHEYEKEYRNRPGVLERQASNARKRRQASPDAARRQQARRLVRTAIEAGVLQRQPCEQCGEPNGHGHHDDYSKPLEIRWLCRIHHAKVHAKASPQESEVGK